VVLKPEMQSLSRFSLLLVHSGTSWWLPPFHFPLHLSSLPLPSLWLEWPRLCPSWSSLLSALLFAEVKWSGLAFRSPRASSPPESLLFPVVIATFFRRYISFLSSSALPCFIKSSPIV
jgi:hypothetical protein